MFKRMMIVETHQSGSSSLCVLRSIVQECHDGIDGIAKFVDESF